MDRYKPAVKWPKPILALDIDEKLKLKLGAILHKKGYTVFFEEKRSVELLPFSLHEFDFIITAVELKNREVQIVGMIP